MKKISNSELQYVAASHENSKNPQSLKKILFTFKDFPPSGRVQMINWACVPKGSKFNQHYHDDMCEVFIVIRGNAILSVSDEKCHLQKGDAVLIPMKKVHQMENIGKQDLEYIVIGISISGGGKTHVVHL